MAGSSAGTDPSIVLGKVHGIESFFTFFVLLFHTICYKMYLRTFKGMNEVLISLQGGKYYGICNF